MWANLDFSTLALLRLPLGDDGAVPATYEDGNPFDYLTNQWAVHDTVLEIGDPSLAHASGRLPASGRTKVSDVVRFHRGDRGPVGAGGHPDFSALAPEVEADR